MHATPLLLIGAGNMGSAILSGALTSKVLDPRMTSVVEPDAARRLALERAHHISAVATPLEAIPWLLHNARAQVLLGIKPQSLTLVGAQFGPAFADRVLISILAGTPGERIRAALPGVRVVRAMPNLAARVRQSTTAVCESAGSRPGDADFALRLFTGIGPVVERIDESLMDAFTALAGSAPAYLFYLAEAMIRTGVGVGFDEQAATRIVKQTLAGAAALMAHDNPAALRAAVTSKGGTTEAAIEVLSDARVGHTIGAAINAAIRRGAELGRA